MLPVRDRKVEKHYTLEQISSILEWTPLTEEDKEFICSVTKNRKFDFSHTYAVGKRCSKGHPQVLVCKPFGEGLKPFPTLFWLICPYLEKRCGVLESEQNVHEVEKLFAEELDSVNDWHCKYRDIRNSFLTSEIKGKIKEKNPALLNSIENYGVGGINWHIAPSAAKCLHLQTATLLGMKEHPAYDLLISMLDSLECENKDCFIKK